MCIGVLRASFDNLTDLRLSIVRKSLRSYCLIVVALFSSLLVITV